MTESVRKELDGYGSRLNTMEKKVSKHCVKIDRNEKDIQDIWGSIATTQKNINGLLIKIFFMISVPTMLLAIQMITIFTRK